MDVPLIDRSQGDVEAQLDPLDQIKPLRWSAIEVRSLQNSKNDKFINLWE